MTDASSELQQLAELCGVATDYWDWRGNHIVVSAETIVAVLAALGVDAATPKAVVSALSAANRYRWSRMLPPCVVTRAEWQPPVWVHVTHGRPVEVWIELETGSSRHDVAQAENWEPPQDVDGRLVGEATFVLPGDLPLGYHTLHARSDNQEATATLIVAPAWLGCPDRMGESRQWGLSTQLYSVRSQRSWGVGDLSDLTDLAVWSAAEHRAGFVLVNPLHAAEPVAPMEPSPYLPTTRRFANPLYLRPELIPEFAYLDSAARTKIEDLRESLAAQTAGADTVDRDTAWTAKRAALELIHSAPRTPGREASFRGYVGREGVGLDDFATWCALVEHHGADWHLWPEGLRHPRAAEVTEFREANTESVDFHRWLQWVLDEQLDAVQAAARRAGMVLGVVHDLAVGVHSEGADSWILQDVLAQGINVGAPPDPFNQMGQDWQQPPWRPDRLADLAYAPFREIVSTTLRHAGGVRVDHVLGLFRMWWIPKGQPPTAGTFVRYDHEALTGILALEAHRADALVVGEDLGTVEPWVRRFLRERGILGTSILWFEFEFDGSGDPLRPEWWREYCLASVTTHDLPPTAGYLAGDHIRLRDSLGLLTRPLDEELAADEADRGAWLDELRKRGALRPDAGVEETIRALHRFLTKTPSRLICVSLSDAVGDRRTQNQPGTIDEYPNWRVPLTGPDGEPMVLEDVVGSERAAALAEVVRQGIGGGR
jgi:4-alpha-glucanotransferase